MVNLLDLPRLNEEELEMCRKAFQLFDKDGSGTIDVKELKTALTALGQQPTDEELFVMISQVDEDGSKEIEFQEFIHAIQINKAMSEKNSNEQETIDAFVALGGNADKTGKIPADRLREIIEEFELTLNVDKFIAEVDKDASGWIEFEEFRALLM
uniref:EF-hand domain-containing protein n=1 Tax=Chlamydomonas leiostraca TaxID=1034604 RepID=A0A7S0RM74_9CHLO|mmetsp:Transcript_26514/g.67438  ORF Transcript_26514/g.67438 Transcript_26514/m.67438 type:complete len:155 (+) Transcript_26514:157-621(+)